MGGGHVIRQLALAGGLRAAGATVEFACRTTDGLASAMVVADGFVVHEVAADVDDMEATRRAARGPFDWVVVDQYELDAKWERAARSFARRILAVDDLADRPHDADLLVDQNHYADYGRRYAELVRADCECLLGPQYALLRPAFLAARRLARSRDGTVRRILVSLGATDPMRQTPVVLEALKLLDLRVHVDVASGKTAEDIASLMVEADLALGSGGVSTSERMCLGVPALVVATHPSQEKSARDVDAMGAHRYLGAAQTLGVKDYATAVSRLVVDTDCLRRMSEEGMRMVDGRGAERVTGRMLA